MEGLGNMGKMKNPHFDYLANGTPRSLKIFLAKLS